MLREREYPPMLMGRPEEQLSQLRAYLVRLIGYIDEAFGTLSSGGSSPDEDNAMTQWQLSVDNALGALKTSVRAMPQILRGTVTESGSITFARPFAAKPAVFTTAGTASDVSAGGFTLTTSGEAQWIAVGEPTGRQ